MEAFIISFNTDVLENPNDKILTMVSLGKRFTELFGLFFFAISKCEMIKKLNRNLQE